jgi:Na+-transporting NADH:ubiquinone oxidoreductase subunit B
VSDRWKTVFSFRPSPPRAGHLPQGFRVNRATLLTAVAAVPYAVASAWVGHGRSDPLRLGLILAAACGGCGVVEFIFAAVRGRALSFGWLATGLLLGLILPADVSLWQVALGAGFGTFFGCQVFGGIGHQLFQPALVGKCFLMVSYGVSGRLAAPASGGWPIAVLMGTAGAGALLLVLTGVIRLHTLLSPFAAAAALWAILYWAQPDTFAWRGSVLASAAFVFTVCLVTTDRVTSPGTLAGQWVYGAFVGLVAVVIRVFGSVGEDIAFATLLGNLFAPAIDIAVRAAGRARTQEQRA